MPTVIDSLVVTLGLDAAKFTTGQRTAREDLTKTRQNANTAAKEISASGAQAAQFFGKLRNEALSLAAVFVGGMGLKSLVQNINTADAATGRLSRNLGISTETLTTWGAVIERAGGSATEAATTFSNLTRAYQEYQATGQTAITPYLQRLGINNPSELRDIPALLMKIGDTIERERMSPQQANFLMAGAGLDEGMRNFLLMSRQRREAALAESAALGAARKKDTDAAEALEAAFLKTKQAIMDVGRSILTEISGPLQDALKAVNLWLSSDENRKWLRLEIEAIGVSIRSFLRDVDAIAVAMGGWKSVTIALFELWVGAKFLGVVASLTRILTLLGAIPGSGVSAATLAALGIAALPLATKSDTADNQQANEAAEAARQGPEALKAWQDAHPNMGQRFWDYIRGAVGGGSSASGGSAGPVGTTADRSMPLEERALLDALSGGESKGDYNARNPAGAYGRYQFIPSTRNALLHQMGLPLNTPLTDELQDKMAILLAKQRGWRPGMSPEASAELLNRIWVSLPGGSEQNTSSTTWAQRLANARAAEADRDRQGGPRIAGAPGAGYRPLTREETTGVPSGGTWNVPARLGDTAHGRWPAAMMATPEGRAAAAAAAASDRASAAAALAKYGPLRQGLIPPPGSTIPLPPGPLSSNQSETHIGQIAIHTQATDANGIARGIGPALSRFGLVAQANTGLA